MSWYSTSPAFTSGISGDSGGRPPLPTEGKKTLARDAAPKALQRLTELIWFTRKGDVVLAACGAILDHAYEKVPSETELLTRRSAN